MIMTRELEFGKVQELTPFHEKKNRLRLRRCYERSSKRLKLFNL